MLPLIWLLSPAVAFSPTLFKSPIEVASACLCACLAQREVAGSQPGVYLSSLLISPPAHFTGVNSVYLNEGWEKETAATALSCLTLKTRSGSTVSFNLSCNPALNSTYVHCGVLLNDINNLINPFIELKHDCGWKKEYYTQFIAGLRDVWGLCLWMLSHLSGTFPEGSETQPLPVTSRSANVGAALRAVLSLHLCFSSPPSLSWSDIVAHNNFCGIWNMSHFLSPQKYYCASLLHKQKESNSICYGYRATFVPANNLTLVTTGILKTMHVCGLYQGHSSSWL